MTTITAKKVLLKDENGNALIPYTEQTNYIGQIISMNCSPSYVPEGTLPCDGGEYTKAQFNDLWDNYFSTIGWNYNYDDFINPKEVTVEDQYMSLTPIDSTYYPLGEGVDWSLCFNLSDVTNYYQLCLIYNADMGDMYVVIDNGELKVTLFGSLTPITSVSTGDLYVKREDEMLWYSTNGIEWEGVFSIGSGSTDIYPNILGRIDLSKSYIGGVQLATPITLLNTCSYQEYESDLATYGQCVKFAVDVDNETFRVPLIKDGVVIQQALTDGELGKAYNAGLPNITGTISSGSYSPKATGAFYDAGGSCSSSPNSGGSTSLITFDSSLANSIYGNSDTVQMNAVALRYFVVVANGQTNQSMMDWSAWASGLQGKMNADHSNDTKPYIIEVSDKSLMPSWYRVWSDGWCEQGGISEVSTSTTTISLLKEFSDRNTYNVSMNGSAGYQFLSARNLSYFIADTSANATVNWIAKGYIN